MSAVRVSLCLVAAAISAAGCDSLTSVEAPDVVEPSGFVGPAAATAFAAGAVGQFHTAYGGNGEGSQVLSSGAISDELTMAASTAAIVPWDSRNAQDPAAITVPYTLLHDARQRLLTAIASFQQMSPDSSARIGHLFALLGYTSVFFGENFCAGVPLDHRDARLRPVFGQPLTTAHLFDSAIVAFDSALAYGVDSARIVNLARIGRARALLNNGRYAEAAAAVSGVPTTYVYNVTFVSGVSHNGLATTGGVSTTASNRHSVPEAEGTNGINWRSASDPRTPLTSRNVSGVGTIFQSAAQQSSTSPIRLAGGTEARLIEAEAALQAGQVTTWLGIHNALRATVAGLAPLSDPGTLDGRVNLHFRERAFWLFLTGHRHGDLRRLVRQYQRGAETVFPIGIWRTGEPYGTATNMAPPASQQLNHPYFTGCLNRDA